MASYLGISIDHVRVGRPLVNGRVQNSQVQSSALVETDVSDLVEAYLEPFREVSSAGTVELPIRLKNKSEQPIYGPIKVEVVSITGNSYDSNTKQVPALEGALLNANA